MHLWLLPAQLQLGRHFGGEEERRQKGNHLICQAVAGAEDSQCL